MSKDERPHKPIPLVLWAIIGFVLVLGFMFALRAVNQHSAGIEPPMTEVAIPNAPEPAP